MNTLSVLCVLSGRNRCVFTVPQNKSIQQPQIRRLIIVKAMSSSVITHVWLLDFNEGEGFNSEVESNCPSEQRLLITQEAMRQMSKVRSYSPPETSV